MILSEKQREYHREWYRKNKHRYYVICPKCKKNMMKNKRHKQCKECADKLFVLKAKSRVGNENVMWKGDKVEYDALHQWMKRHKPKPQLCELCNKEPPRDLANISGEYKRDLDDFQWVCRRCHMKSDDRMSNLIKYEKGHVIPLDERKKKNGIMGVRYHKRDGLWIATMRINGREKHLGSSLDIYKTIEIKRKAEIKYFGYTIIPKDITTLVNSMVLRNQSRISEIEVVK